MFIDSIGIESTKLKIHATLCVYLMLGKSENNYCYVTSGAVSKVEIGCDWFNASLLFLFSSMTAEFYLAYSQGHKRQKRPHKIII